MKTSWGSRVGVIMTVLLLGASLAHAQGDELLVSDVQANQAQGTGIVYVIYRLETIGDFPVTVSLFLSTDGGLSYPHLCGSVTGDIGSGVSPGWPRLIIWNAGVDIPGVISDNCRLRVTADDGMDVGGFIFVSQGTFMMGSPTDEPGRSNQETLHQVTLTHGIDVKSTEVTNQQYIDMAQWAYDHGYLTVTSTWLRDNLDGSTVGLLYVQHDSEITFSSGAFTCVNADHPVMYVTWYGSAAYCDWLSMREGLPRAYNHSTWQCNGGYPYSAAGYRLPTEAEWEYTCRAGSTTAFANGPITYLECAPLDPNLDAMGWYCGNAGWPNGWTFPVAQKNPNAWGLYDMHGNLYEWCNDWIALYEGDTTNPVGPGNGSYRVVRGGFWNSYPPVCRAAHRNSYYPSDAGDLFGFRPVRTVN